MRRRTWGGGQLLLTAQMTQRTRVHASRRATDINVREVISEDIKLLPQLKQFARHASWQLIATSSGCPGNSTNRPYPCSSVVSCALIRQHFSHLPASWQKKALQSPCGFQCGHSFCATGGLLGEWQQEVTDSHRREIGTQRGSCSKRLCDRFGC